MSLLLQALQKAAKNRESGASPPESVGTPPPPEPVASILPSAFTLDPKARDQIAPREPELALEDEDLFEPDELPPAPAPALEHADERFEPFAAPAASSAQAATILRASETPTAGWVDWVQEHPVHTFAAVAGVFAVFYGAYLYLQLFHPAVLRGDFLSRPVVPQTPTPATQPITPPPPVSVADTGASTPAAAGIAPGAQTPGAPTPAAATQRAAPAAGKIAGMPSPGKSAEAPLATPNPRVQAEQGPPPAPRRSRKPAGATTAVEDIFASRRADAGGAPVSAGITRAYLALQAGELDQAESAYRQVVQDDPHNLDAMLGLATIASQRGNAQQAIGFYERALELEPQNAAAQAGVIAIIGQADPQLSETRLKQLIAREPLPFLYFGLGNLYARQNLWAPAQSAYFQAYQMQPDNPDYAYNLAIGLEHLSQSKLALTYYRKALELSFQKGHANFDQSRVIERIGQLSARVN